MGNYELIQLISSSEPQHIENLIKLKLNEVLNLTAETLYIILSLSFNESRLRIFNLLHMKLDELYIKELIDILQCFNEDKYKYYIFYKLVKKCIFDDHSHSVKQYFQDASGNKAKRILENLQDKRGNTIMKNVIVTHIESPSRDKVELSELLHNFKGKSEHELTKELEKSIVSLNLDGVNKYCDDLRDMLSTENYIKSCEILGINPEVFMKYL
jgi:hypothetical protein